MLYVRIATRAVCSSNSYFRNVCHNNFILFYNCFNYYSLIIRDNHVVGRVVLDIRICASPGRDKEIDEARFAGGIVKRQINNRKRMCHIESKEEYTIKVI